MLAILNETCYREEVFTCVLGGYGLGGVGHVGCGFWVVVW